MHDEWLAMVASVGGGLAVVPEPVIDYRAAPAATRSVSHGSVRVAGWHGCGSRAPSGTPSSSNVHATSPTGSPRIAEGDARVGAGVQGKLEHEIMRQGIPADSLRRIAPVWREWHAGHYGRYGRGAQDVLRDLVQPV